MAKVLVVDDESICCLSIQESLEEVGHEVKTATEGAQAVEIARGFKPEVLVTDYLLRGEIDGIGLAKRLLSNDPKLKIVLMTGLAEAAMEQQQLQIPQAVLVRKPLTFEEIAVRVQELIKEAK